jgi:thymidylate synthase (FAD)
MKLPKLIAITQPDPELNITPEEFIAYAARISNPSNQMNTATAPKLLHYLVKAGHWSPFDMVDMTVEVTTSKAIAIQLLRHWSFRFQEWSQRYSAVEELDYDHLEVRQKAAGGNRQGSDGVKANLTETAQGNCDANAYCYQLLLAEGAAPESARMVLPMATLTTLYVKGSIRSWMTYFWQRLDPHAQKEHRELAQGIFEVFQKEFPIIAHLVLTYTPSVLENPEWSQPQEPILLK